MAKPATADIEQIYATAEAAGMTRVEVDAIAKPHIRAVAWIVEAQGLRAVRSNGELRHIHQLVADAAAARKRELERSIAGLPTAADGPLATPRQVDYILTLLEQRQLRGDGGGFYTGPTDRGGIAALTRAEASTYIDSLTERY